MHVYKSGVLTHIQKYIIEGDVYRILIEGEGDHKVWNHRVGIYRYLHN